MADHYVLPELSRDQIEAIAADDPSLFIDDLVAAVVQEQFSFRVADVPDPPMAQIVENAVKAVAYPPVPRGSIQSGHDAADSRRPGHIAQPDPWALPRYLPPAPQAQVPKLRGLAGG